VTDEAVWQGKEHFKKGQVFLDSGNYDRALEEFETSYEVARRPSALFMLAVTYRRRFEANGDIADAAKARQMYLNFIDAAPEHAKVVEAREQIALIDRYLEEAEKARAQGQPIQERIGSASYRQALGLLAEGDYERAIAMAAKAHREPGGGPEKAAHVWVLVGRAKALAGRTEEAIAAFKRALLIMPGLTPSLDGDAPDGQAFTVARHQLRGVAPISISVTAPKKAPMAQAIDVRVTVDSDPMHMIDKLALYYRVEGSSQFVEKVAGVGGELLIPAEVTPVRESGYRLFYYVLARDQAGATIAFGGSAKLPERVEILTGADWRLAATVPMVSDDRPARRWAGYGALSLGVAALVVAAFDARAARDLSNQINDSIARSAAQYSVHWQDYHEDYDDAKSKERRAEILAAVGGGLVVVGAVLVFTAAGKRRATRMPEASSRHWKLGLQPGRAFVVFERHF